MERIIACLDMDAFFASVEQRDNPALRGKPVIVGEGPRAVVAAASYEARAFGIHSAMPVTQARRLCPQAVFLPGRHRTYAKVSRDIFERLNEFSPVVDPASIDECYLDLTGCQELFGPPHAHAHRIQDAIRRDFELTCSIGIGPNRLIAKMASGMRKPDGLTIFESETEAARAFAPLDVEKLIGIGPKTAEPLRRMGIHTIGDLAAASPERLEDRFGSGGLDLIQRAQGHAEGGWWNSEDDEPQSVGHMLTFEKDTADPRFLSKVLLMLSDHVGRRLRDQQLAGRSVTVMLRTADFKTRTRNVRLPSFTSDPLVIYNAARSLVLRETSNRAPLRLLGVTVRDLIREGEEPQRELFNDEGTRARPLFRAIDRIRGKFGSNAVHWAALQETPEKSGKKREKPVNPFGRRRSENGD